MSGYTAQIVEGYASEFRNTSSTGRGPGSFKVNGKEIWAWPETKRAGKNVRNPVYLAAMAGAYGQWTVNDKQEEYQGQFFIRTYATEFTASAGPGDIPDEHGEMIVEPAPVPPTGAGRAYPVRAPHVTAHIEGPKSMPQQKRQWVPPAKESEKYASFALSYAKDFVLGLLPHTESLRDGAYSDLVLVVIDVAEQFKSWLDDSAEPKPDTPESTN